jgi:hypothetical protein
MLNELIQKFNPKDPRQTAISKAFKALKYPKKIKDLDFYKTVTESSLAEQREWMLALMVALKKIDLEAGDKNNIWHQRWELRELLFSLLKRKLPFTAQDMLLLAEWSSGMSFYSGRGCAPLTKAWETYFKANQPPHDPAVLAALQAVAEQMGNSNDADAQRYSHKLTTLLQEAGAAPGPRQVPSPLDEEDAWAAAAKTEIAALDLETANAWNTLLTTCAQTKSSAPSTKWLAQARAERETVSWPAVRAAIFRWFPLVDTPRVVDEEDVARMREYYRDQYRESKRWEMAAINGDVLKGLLWLTADQEDAEVARAVSRLVKDCFRKIPGQGARLARVGNAGLWALGQMPGMDGVAQLAILKTRLKLPIIQKQIAAAFDETAKRLGLSQEDVEELVVPDYGLQEVGLRREQLGEFTAEIVVSGSDAELRWLGADHKPRKSLPAAVKSEHGELYKELNQAVKDIRTMLPAQRDRIDGLFLARKKWPLAAWRERYLDHPLVGTIARRLIWKFSQGDQAASGIWWQGQIVGRDEQPLNWLSDATHVELWHPLNVDTAIVLEWRDFLAQREIQQPFKQAHREIYLLTDAERQTHTYSNRFAAHVLKQHQFNALCAARGWKNQLRLMVDASFPPAMRYLPLWGLRAEYWVEGIGDDYGTDTNDTGTYLYVATDQVRFYSLGTRENYAHAYGGGYGEGRWASGDTGGPLELEQIPPLVLSEILRDVDLFVGVASVGNDPNWSDGGPHGRHANYWHSYSFGELSATAQTRRQVLELLLPRLKIAGQCRLVERFLVVKGSLRTYKIHLGSGNILMEPNDQYLCIVPGRSPITEGKLFLPFEGDQTLAVILSKAFLLAEDTKITDPSITRQIK